MIVPRAYRQKDNSRYELRFVAQPDDRYTYKGALVQGRLYSTDNKRVRGWLSRCWATIDVVDLLALNAAAQRILDAAQAEFVLSNGAV